MLPEFGHLGTHDMRAIALKGIASEIFLMVGLSLKPPARRDHFSDDRIRVKAFLSDRRHHIVGNLFLLGGVIEDRGTVLRPAVIALPIERRGIVDHEEHIQQITIADYLWVERDPHRFRMSGPSPHTCS